MGESSDLVGDRSVQLTEFRNIVKTFLKPELLEDDSFLMRWLTAREYNLEKAQLMLKNYVEWNATNDIANILSWSPPEELKDACPFKVLCNDLEGRPVLDFPWGKWKPWIFAEKYLDVYQKYMDYMINSVVSCIKSPATQFVILGDSEGFTYGHMKYVKALEVNLEAVRQFESHYPELLHSAIVINCPRAFTILYSLLKPMISHRTRNKIHIFGCDKSKWLNFLSQRISQEDLPKNYRME